MSKATKEERTKTAAEITAAKVNEPETDAAKAMAEEEGAAVENESADKAKEQIQRVYCGPSIKNVVREGTVFAGGIPEALEEYIKENPAVRSLIVPLTDFAAFRANIGHKGTPANIIYNNALSVTKRRK